MDSRGLPARFEAEEQIAIAQRQTTEARQQVQAEGLGVSGRRRALADLFHKAGLDIIGVQEARTREAKQWKCGHYWIISSGAAEDGSAGVELWIHERLGLNPKDIHVVHLDPRRLLAALRLPCG